MSFKDLISEPAILQAIEDSGYTMPTPIQSAAIPMVLSGADLRASAQTGTGKTAAFILPALCRLTKPSTLPGKGPRVLVLVPTRELAMQVAAEAAKYSKRMPRVRTICIYGGAPYHMQYRDLSRPVEILVATPGRLIDHLERGKVDLSRVEMLILDEADRMLDMGFIDPVEQIAAATPKNRQTLMFSATLKGSVMNLSKRLLNDPKEVAVAAELTRHDHIEQRIHAVDSIEHKNRLLNHILTEFEIDQAIIFTATKFHADRLVDELIDQGHHAAALHGDMNQRQRTRTIQRLRSKEVQFLVATDVAARGIDIQSITHVINFDLPMCAEDYVHRIGRTGRAGATGMALSFVSHRDRPLLKRIEQFTGQKLTSHVIPGMEPQSKVAAPAAPKRYKRPGNDQRRDRGRRERSDLSRLGPGEGRRDGKFRPQFKSRRFPSKSR
ncbi:MAG: DEAD/DEAH box helicase [Verrucomicrobia bacterium]|nr:DEAD/DEAH box helicase [Verrucomicrobiota bacterium]